MHAYNSMACWPTKAFATGNCISPERAWVWRRQAHAAFIWYRLVCAIHALFAEAATALCVKALEPSSLFMVTLQDAFRKAATAALTKRLQSSIAAATTAAGSELDSLFNVQAQLTQWVLLLFSAWSDTTFLLPHLLLFRHTGFPVAARWPVSDAW